MENRFCPSLLLRGIFVLLRPILWYGFFAEVILQYVVFGKYRADVRNPLLYAVLAVILCVPFWGGWIRDALSCNSFSGTVEKMKIRHRLQTSVAGAKFRPNRMIVTEHLYVIRTDKGRRVRFRIREPNFEYSRYFAVGTRVVHSFGARFFERAIPTGNDRLCIVCGTLCRREQTVCPNCRNKLF